MLSDYFGDLSQNKFSYFNVRTEECSAAGRFDVVVETVDAYVFEFKLRGISQEVLAQIDEKG